MSRRVDEWTGIADISRRLFSSPTCRLTHSPLTSPLGPASLSTDATNAGPTPQPHRDTPLLTYYSVD